MPHRKWNDEDLAEAIKTSENWIEVVQKIGVSSNSESGMTRIRRYAESLNLDASHFVKKTKDGWRKYSDDIFRKGIQYNSSIRRYFTESVEYKCSILECGLNEWQGQPITLQVDHIDGDITNNLKDNLRLLCPNCHAQTETWGVPKAHRK